MGAKRVSKVVVTGVTEGQFETAMAAYAIASSKGDKLEASMEQELTKVREKYAERLNNVAEDKVKQMGIVETYCLDNKAQLFSKMRHLDTIHGKVGFRMSPPILKLLKGSKWKDVLERLKAQLPDFVRTKEEVDKEGILARRHEEDVANLLPDVGVFADQNELFYVDLKKEEVL